MRDAFSKIQPRNALAALCRQWKEQDKTIVFTNGVFDVLHAGHVEYLNFARAQGDQLIVGINSDDSVRRYKGENRPINPQHDRALILASLEAVDCVTIFEEDEPKRLLEALLPHILVKGSDWSHLVVGREIVEENGGRIVLAPFKEGRSSTSMIDRIVEVYGEAD
jgi:rfaE bifunctional protein nucleotidyltransferase chain/domain